MITGTHAIAEPLRRSILTVGNFDGLHVGHRAILDTVVRRSRDLDGEAVVLTFDPHPRQVLRPENALRLLTTLEQKVELLEEAGLDVLVVQPFSAEFARTPPEVFIRQHLHERIAPLEVYVGYDFHFGRDRAGSMRLLTELGPKLGFAVTIIPEVTIDGRDVNSTRIRELLGQGEVEEAERLLGRPYSVRGTVLEGDRRGRTLGFPTANLDPGEQVVPAAGVYAGRVRFLDDGEPARGSERPSVANVGTRPTFTDSSRVWVEAHLLDFAGDLYGRRVAFHFCHHLRPEQRFEGPEKLQAQIRADLELGRRRLEGS